MAKIDTTQTLVMPLSAWGRLAANSTAHMVEHLFNGVIAVILPLITTSLGLSLAQAGALVSARTLMSGVASFPSGFFADLASRRNLLLGFCLGMIGLGCLGLSAASSFFALLIFMALSRRWRRRFSSAVPRHSVRRLSGEARLCIGRSRQQRQSRRSHRATRAGSLDHVCRLAHRASDLGDSRLSYRAPLRAVRSRRRGCGASEARLSTRSLGRRAQEQNRFQSSRRLHVARHGANGAERVFAALFVVAPKTFRRRRRERIYRYSIFSPGWRRSSSAGLPIVSATKASSLRSQS